MLKVRSLVLILLVHKRYNFPKLLLKGKRYNGLKKILQNCKESCFIIMTELSQEAKQIISDPILYKKLCVSKKKLSSKHSLSIWVL